MPDAADPRMTPLPNPESSVPVWLDLVNEVVFHSDTQGRLTFVNTAWSRTTGFTLQESVGRDLAEFVVDGDRELHRSRFLGLLQGRRASLQHEMRVRTRGGAERWLELRACGEADATGRIVGAAGTLTDISTRREMTDELRSLAYEAEESRADAESAAQLLRVVAEDVAQERDEAAASGRANTEFLASMVHDLRTPLNGVLGMTEILLHGGLDDAQRKLALTVRESAESLARLVGDIVEFTSAAGTGSPIADEDFDMRDVIGDVTRLLTQKALARGVGFQATVAPSLPARLRGDVARTRQMITNLASNAVRFAGGRSVSAAATRPPDTRPDGRVAVRIKILDNDAHMTADQITELLRRPAAAVPDPGDHGTAGLGLAVALRLVERMSGTVVASSEPGRGCGLMIELPLALSASPAPARDPAASHAAAPLHLRVLIAEDSLVNQKVTVHLLSRRGVRADVVADGQAALDALEAGHYDVVLMDVCMPGMDGFQATAAIRARDAARGTHTPVVAMTAHALTGDRKRCFEAGMDGFLAKPVQAGDLYAEIAKWAAPRAGEERAAA